MNTTEEKTISTEEESLVVEFNKPFKWEDKEYTSIDLSGLDQLSGRQLGEIYKEFGKLGVVAPIPTQNPDFAALTASKVTGLPIEFFKDLPGRELFRISNKVFGYFFTED